MAGTVRGCSPETAPFWGYAWGYLLEGISIYPQIGLAMVWEIPPMALTVTALKNTKPRAKPYKLADEKGLFVIVSPSGGYFGAGSIALMALARMASRSGLRSCW